MPKLELYCLCGAYLRATLPHNTLRKAERLWRAEHDGPGHGDTDRATCHLAARMADDRAIKEAADATR